MAPSFVEIPPPPTRRWMMKSSLDRVKFRVQIEFMLEETKKKSLTNFKLKEHYAADQTGQLPVCCCGSKESYLDDQRTTLNILHFRQTFF